MPVGSLDTDYVFLPEADARWDATPHECARSTLTIGAASDTCNAFPVPPRQYVGTLSFGF